MSTQTSSADDGSLNIAFFSVLVVSLFSIFMFCEGDAAPKEGEKREAVLSSLDEEIKEHSKKEEDIAIHDENTLMAKSTPANPQTEVRGVYQEEEQEEEQKEEDVKQRWVNVSAYAPLDPNAISGMCYSGDPNITASGSRAREGIVATNFLDFGTEIRIPSLFGDKVLVVEDRMSPRFNNTIDVLVSTQEEAVNFGTKHTYIEILTN